MIKFYDLVPSLKTGPFFSPATTRARLAFLWKRVEFQVVETTYLDLQGKWKEQFAIKTPRVPFIQKDDGSYLMDSIEICKWLETTYPTSGPSIYLPETDPSKIDFDSVEYKQAVKNSKMTDYLDYNLVFDIYAPRMVKMFDQETQEYWTSESRMGPGRWERIASLDQDERVAKLQKNLDELGASHFDDQSGKLFLQSPSKPGYLDFSLMGAAKMLSACSTSLLNETFARPDTPVGAWYERMTNEPSLREGWKAMISRDPIDAEAHDKLGET